MIRKAVLFQVKPGQAAEYERRHNPVPPEIAALLKKHGVSNYSIYLHEPTGLLFGYFEAESEEALAGLDAYEVNHRWWESNAKILVCEHEGDKKGKEEELREVFHLD